MGERPGRQAQLTFSGNRLPDSTIDDPHGAHARCSKTAADHAAPAQQLTARRSQLARDVETASPRSARAPHGPEVEHAVSREQEAYEQRHQAGVDDEVEAVGLHLGVLAVKVGRRVRGPGTGGGGARACGGGAISWRSPCVRGLWLRPLHELVHTRKQVASVVAGCWHAGVCDADPSWAPQKAQGFQPPRAWPFVPPPPQPRTGSTSPP